MEIEERHVSVSLGWDVCRGLANSKWCRALLVSSLFLAEVMAGSFLITGAAPAGWMIAAAIVSGYIVGLLIQLPFHRGWGQVRAEMGALVKKIYKKYKTDLIIEITNSSEKQATIYLGILPNRIGSQGEDLINGDRKIGAVLSINERFERKPCGLSLPYTSENWKELGAEYHQITADDHMPLSMEDLDQAADWIHGWIEEGKNIYVHCLAGRGRSAMAIGAYLIKYQKDNPSLKGDKHLADRIADFVFEKRSITLLHRPGRLNRLKHYYSHCHGNESKKEGII